MKTREEYLNEYENKLIEQYTDIFRRQGKHLFSVYVLTGFYLMFVSGFIEELNLLGNKIEVGNEYLQLFLPIVLLSLYVFLNYQTIRIAKMIQKIRSNSAEILEINSGAKPLSSEDMFFFSSGPSGLILSFSKWQFRYMISQKIYQKYKSIRRDDSLVVRTMRLFVFLNDLGKWLIATVVSLTVILGIFLLPLIAILIVILYTSDNEILTGRTFIAIIAILSITILGTAVATMTLLIFYLNDLIEDLKTNLESSVADFKRNMEVSIESLKKSPLTRRLIRLIKRITERMIGHM